MEFCSFPLLEVIPVDVGVFIELGKPLSDNLGIGESLQRLVLCTEYILPIAIRMPVFVHNPVSTLVLVSPFCPGYEHIIDDIIQFAEDSGRDCNWRCKSAHFRRAKSAHLLTFKHALEGSGNAEDGGLSHDT